MMKRSRSSAKKKPVLNPRPVFTAAVRYGDGRNELLHVKNALDIHDARQVVLDALIDVHSLLIAELKLPPAKVLATAPA